MTHQNTPILDDRDLTSEERDLIRWMLENGNKGGRKFLGQLERARVHARCPCGCASIDLTIDGKTPTDFRMHILGDFQWKNEAGNLFGAFVFEQDGLLGGLDLWSVDGAETPSAIPRPEQLVSLE
ncbi:hypothetical protein AZ34_05355 [Hylemonella gracilis str. Niagara R]|jgi:hypothetical protein|uniref:Uncharacterized protein n=1 Tax=Hylemonella gracilis str. Niagara R TaxID=1458275 RepID=A0A016XL27_9BURK|nr:hypothetical protein [Hylemonella gracilis]EYC52809.1 hypothetical protein AZ34_05355 [Hylemonella gracilis str. Niagara R]